MQVECFVSVGGWGVFIDCIYLWLWLNGCSRVVRIMVCIYLWLWGGESYCEAPVGLGNFWIPPIESGDASSAEAVFYNGLSLAHQRRVLEEPGRAAHFWEADHVRAVADGGGEAELIDFQILCIVCHAQKTRSERKRRAAGSI